MEPTSQIELLQRVIEAELPELKRSPRQIRRKIDRFDAERLNVARLLSLDLYIHGAVLARQYWSLRPALVVEVPFLFMLSSMHSFACHFVAAAHSPETQIGQ